MAELLDDHILPLETTSPIWNRFFTVAPLVLIGTVDAGGEANQAPKHMAFPLGWENYYGFVCTPRHSTYSNIQRTGVFTVTYPQPSQVVLTSLAAAPRDDDGFKPSLASLPTIPSQQVKGFFVKDGSIFLECELDRIVDGFGSNSLIAGRILGAHVHRDALRTSDKDDGEVIFSAPLLAYLEPGRFARIDQSFSFPYPQNFKR